LTKRNVKDPEERKQELINIASRLFEKYGYEKVSVRDILAEVNGAPGMFYYYFKSKEDIFLACMETELIHYIGKFIDVYSEFIIEGIENKKIENNMGINRENVRSFAAFILYGAVGTIYNDYIIKGENKTNSSEAFGIISELFQRPH